MAADPTYENVRTGTTGQTESIEVVFDQRGYDTLASKAAASST